MSRGLALHRGGSVVGMKFALCVSPCFSRHDVANETVARSMPQKASASSSAEHASAGSGNADRSHLICLVSCRDAGGAEVAMLVV